MDYKKLESAVYSEGFVEDYLERLAVEASDDPVDFKHRQEVLAAWKIFDAAFNELRKENQDMQQKLYSLRTILT